LGIAKFENNFIIMKRKFDILQVENLKEKTEVQFRVIAVNKAGESPASEPTQNHLVRHRKCKFYTAKLVFCHVL